MKKILLALLFCLSMTNIVNAQSAWVLWEKFYINEEGKIYTLEEGKKVKVDKVEWKVVNAYPTYEDCVGGQMANFLYTPEQKGFKVFSKPFEYESVKKQDGKLSVLHELKCLPDTIDPRK